MMIPQASDVVKGNECCLHNNAKEERNDVEANQSQSRFGPKNDADSCFLFFRPTIRLFAVYLRSDC